MGLRVEPVASVLEALRPTPPVAEQERPELRIPERRRAQPPPRPRQENRNTTLFFEQEEAVVERAGFGEGSVTVPGQTLRALGGGLQSARELVPSAEELREEVRERFAEQREEDLRQLEAHQAQQINARTFAAERAQNFVNQVNEAANVAQARLQGEELEPARNPATIQVNGQTFEMPRPNTPQVLDVLV